MRSPSRVIRDVCSAFAQNFSDLKAQSQQESRPWLPFYIKHQSTQATCLIYASKDAFVAEIVLKFLELTKLPTGGRATLIIGGRAMKIDHQRIEDFGLSPHSTVEIRFEQLLGGSLLVNKVSDLSIDPETGKKP